MLSSECTSSTSTSATRTSRHLIWTPSSARSTPASTCLMLMSGACATSHSSSFIGPRSMHGRQLLAFSSALINTCHEMVEMQEKSCIREATSVLSAVHYGWRSDGARPLVTTSVWFPRIHTLLLIVRWYEGHPTHRCDTPVDSYLSVTSVNEMTKVKKGKNTVRPISEVLHQTGGRERHKKEPSEPGLPRY